MATSLQVAAVPSQMQHWKRTIFAVVVGIAIVFNHQFRDGTSQFLPQYARGWDSFGRGAAKSANSETTIFAKICRNWCSLCWQAIDRRCSTTTRFLRFNFQLKMFDGWTGTANGMSKFIRPSTASTSSTSSLHRGSSQEIRMSNDKSNNKSQLLGPTTAILSRSSNENIQQAFRAAKLGFVDVLVYMASRGLITLDVIDGLERSLLLVAIIHKKFFW